MTRLPLRISSLPSRSHRRSSPTAATCRCIWSSRRRRSSRAPTLAATRYRSRKHRLSGTLPFREHDDRAQQDPHLSRDRAILQFVRPLRGRCRFVRSYRLRRSSPAPRRATSARHRLLPAVGVGGPDAVGVLRPLRRRFRSVHSRGAVHARACSNRIDQLAPTGATNAFPHGCHHHRPARRLRPFTAGGSAAQGAAHRQREGYRVHS